MVEFQITALVCTSIELIGTLNMYKYQIIHLLAGVIEMKSCEIVIHIPRDTYRITEQQQKSHKRSLHASKFYKYSLINVSNNHSISFTMI